MLYFDKSRQILDSREKQKSISILNFIVRNDTQFLQDITITQNGTPFDFSFGTNYLTIIPLTIDGIITNYIITGDNNGKITLQLTKEQIQAISITDSNSREFRIRREVAGILTDIAIGKLKIETYPTSVALLEENTMKIRHNVGEGAIFSISSNADNIVITDIIDVITGLSTKSGAEITYNGNTAEINLYFDRSVDVIYSSFNN